MIRGGQAVIRSWSEGRLAERAAALALIALPALAALGIPPAGLLEIPGGYGAASPIAEFKSFAVRWGYAAVLALLAFVCIARPRSSGEAPAPTPRARRPHAGGDAGRAMLHRAIVWGLGAHLAFVALAALASIAPAFSFWRALDTLLPAGLALAVVAAAWRLDADRFIAGVTITGAFVAAIVLLQHLGHNPLGWAYTLQMERPDERAELIATIGNPEFVGGYLAAVTSCAFVAGCFATRRSRYLLLAAVPFLLAAMMATGTRSSLLAVGAGLMYAAAMALRRRASLRTLGIGAGVAAAVLVVGAIVLSTPNPLNPRLANLAGRFGELFDLRSPSIRERVLTNVAAAELIAERPWVGHGAGMFNARFYDAMAGLAERDDSATVSSALETLNERGAGAAHNDYLQMWAESGLAGLASFLLMAVALLALPPSPLPPSPGDAPDERSAGVDAGAHAGRLACQTALATLLASSFVSFPLHSPERACLFWALVAHIAAPDRRLRAGAAVRAGVRAVRPAAEPPSPREATATATSPAAAPPPRHDSQRDRKRSRRAGG